MQQQEINNAAWAACNNFAGMIDVANFKDYIFVMLFLKYISDRWMDHYQAYRKQYGDDEARIQRKLGRERFILPKGASYYDLYNQRNELNIGQIMNIALGAIETANKDKLEGVFRHFDFNSEAKLGQTEERNRRLSMLLEDFNKPVFDMRPSRISEDLIGNVYIYLIERFASDAGKQIRAFYTPHKVSTLVARLCKPKVGARICDPTCGFGGLLIEAGKAVGDPNYAMYGINPNHSKSALCRMNMFVHGADSVHIETCNVFALPIVLENNRQIKFDNIVASPPFSPDKGGDYDFISQMINATVEKEGRVSVVVPYDLLSQEAIQGRIRAKLIKENLLDAVIGLSGNLFTSTSTPVAILIFDRSREQGGVNENRQDVLFINASQDYQPGKNQHALLDEHIDKILNAYEKRKETPNYAHLASFDELKENDFNLNIPRYVDTFEE